MLRRIVEKINEVSVCKQLSRGLGRQSIKVGVIIVPAGLSVDARSPGHTASPHGHQALTLLPTSTDT